MLYKERCRMNIREATYNDIPELMRLFSSARDYMRKNGNMIQWVNGYPSEELIRSEIENKHCYICIESEKSIGTFCFIIGNDPTYNYIDGGNWINEHPYAVVHRLASDGSYPGVAKSSLDWCFNRCNNIRIDTHEVNSKMQNLLIDYGFKRCGIIYVADGTPRVAFQKETDI